MISLILFIGIPGAGKTTLCNKLSSCFDERYDIKIFCYDQILLEFSKKSRNNVYDMVVCYLTSCKVDRKTIIFIDDNMYYKSMRKKYHQLAKNLKLSFLQIYVKIDLATACERNLTRENKIPPDIIRNMYYKLEEPVEEDVTIICSSFPDFDTNAMTLIKTKIINTFEKPCTSIICEAPKENIISYYQTLDLNLRSIVGAKSKKNPHLSNKYNKIRKEIYTKLKCDFKRLYSEEDMCELFDSYLNI